MIKLFTDECIHTDVIAALQGAAFDVATVRDAGLVGADDEAIFDFARKSSRVLLTNDREFGDVFRFPIAKSAGVIIILIGQMTEEETIAVTIGFLDTIKEAGIDGKLAVIGKTKIRIVAR